MQQTTVFETQFGFRRDEVTLANWRTYPFNKWSFQNVGELVPSASIPAVNGNEIPMQDMSGLLSEKVPLGSKQETVADFLVRSYTDALTVMKDGRIVGDWAAPNMQQGARHIIFSISKSLTAILAGIVEGEGLLDPEAPVTRYVPETAGSAYGDATMRHVLDMVVSIDIDEAYTDPDSAYGRYRKVTLWNPGGGAESLTSFLMTLPRLDEDHGVTFRYRSPNSDLLGIVIERATGRRIPDLLSEKLWQPLGAKNEASITVDMEGAARTAGGMSVTARDLARIGEMMRQGGMANGRRVVPESWVRDTTNAGSAEAWQKGAMVHLFPHGRYRNKWYQPGDGSFCGIGIHGQWLYVDPSAGTVIVKMSSQPEPVDDPLDIECVSFFQALAAMV